MRRIMTNHTPETLRAFEQKVVDAFKNKEIRAPVHLYDGNEEKMIEIFEDIRPQDWVFCSWRSHYQCLLKGVPEDVLMDKIKEGHSISLNFPEYNIFSSAIVGGNIPIALGVAISNHIKSVDSHVYCFVGDMTAETGTFFECWKYSDHWKWPITFIIEDNDKSVCSPTHDVWNQTQSAWEIAADQLDNVIHYKYESKYPHAGVGQRIMF